jgi:hypothetical protein
MYVYRANVYILQTVWLTLEADCFIVSDVSLRMTIVK